VADESFHMMSEVSSRSGFKAGLILLLCRRRTCKLLLIIKLSLRDGLIGVQGDNSDMSSSDGPGGFMSLEDVHESAEVAPGAELERRTRCPWIFDLDAVKRPMSGQSWMMQRTCDLGGVLGRGEADCGGAGRNGKR
jgi:hypothetical protein